MKFEENKTFEGFASKIGFIFSYFLFTTFLFLILLSSDNLYQMNYLHIMGITLILVVIGILIKRFLQ